MTRDGTAAMWTALTRDRGGLVIVWYPDSDRRNGLIDEVRSLLPPAVPVLVTDSVAGAVTRPATAVLLAADDEAGLVSDLEGLREALVDRTAPVVAFLMSKGPGQYALARAPGVASWARGSDPDPDALAEIDADAELERFRADTGVDPDAWLAAEHEPTAENLGLEYRAWLITGSR